MSAANSRSREITLRFLAEPGDVNFGGKVHGGAVMKWIDQAGYACAVSWSGYYCVTVSVGGIRFLRKLFAQPRDLEREDDTLWLVPDCGCAAFDKKGAAPVRVHP